MKIKVCGMKHSSNIMELLQLQVDYVGFIFYKPSSRYMEEYLSDVTFPDTIKKTGVFVDESIMEISLRIRQYGLDAVQLHGKESPELCQRLKEKGIEVIKSFNISSEDDMDLVAKYTDVCDYFLFDAPTSRHGGSGRKFDWKILQHYQGKTPFFISGGIAPDDVECIRSFHHPSLYAIDLNSRFEQSPALKDTVKIEQFISQLKYKNKENE
jgi:phosphoribosylanthranilate isomerase